MVRYRPYVVAVLGAYGRTLASRAIGDAIKQHKHVRVGYAVRQAVDIPQSILGFGRATQSGTFRFLAGSRMRELAEYEPDTIITELPLLRPTFAPWAAEQILPRLLVFTHSGSQYLDTFGSMDILLHEYLAVAKTLQKDGAVVLNGDDEHLREIAGHITSPVITYGMNEHADVRLLRAVRRGNASGIMLTFTLHGKTFEGYFPHSTSKQHVAGVLAGIAASHAMGIDTMSALKALEGIQAPKGSFSVREGIQGCTVIDDTAEVCPEKIISSLRSFASLKGSGRKFAVLGDSDTLSHFSQKFHEEMGRESAHAAPILMFVGDAMRHAQRAALQSGSHIDTHHFETSQDAAKWLPNHIQNDDLIYIAGGADMKMNRIIDRIGV
jgi:UDP-N-acetylmuramyl pentapeptide synthase